MRVGLVRVGLVRVLLVRVGLVRDESGMTETGRHASPLRCQIRFHSSNDDPMPLQTIGLEIRPGASLQSTGLGARPQVRETLGQGPIGRAAFCVLVDDRQLGVRGRDVGKDWRGYAQGLEFAALESGMGFLDLAPSDL